MAVELVRGLGFEAIYRLRTEFSDWAERVLALPDTGPNTHLAELTAIAALAAALRGDFELADTRLMQAVDCRRPETTISFEEGFAASVLNIRIGKPAKGYRGATLIGLASDVPGEFATVLATCQAAIAATYIGEKRRTQANLVALGLRNRGEVQSVVSAIPKMMMPPRWFAMLAT